MPGRRSTSRSSAAWVVCFAAVAAVVVAGCSSSGTQYVSNRDDRTYFKVPAGWKLFGEEQLIDENGDLSDAQREQILTTSWRTAFDASPQPKIKHLFATNTNFPTGLAIVDTLTGDAADAISDQSMRNSFLPVDQASEADQLTVLSYENVNTSGGFHGIRFRARLTSAADSEVYPEGPAFTFEQISLVDQARAKSYSLIVMCSAKCFEKHADRIEGVIDSWTVEES